jgi:hypothetical protein
MPLKGNKSFAVKKEKKAKRIFFLKKRNWKLNSTPKKNSLASFLKNTASYFYERKYGIRL